MGAEDRLRVTRGERRMPVFGRHPDLLFSAQSTYLYNPITNDIDGVFGCHAFLREQ
jgi:hypothetical protein